MQKTVDYPGRTSCGCPYVNNSDPQAHWDTCGYRLNAARPQPAEVDAEARHDAVKKIHDIMAAVPCASLYSLAEAVLDAGYSAQHHRITEQLRAEFERLRELLAWLRGAVNCNPQNDIDKMGAWISTKHPMIERIDAALNPAPAKENEA